MTYSQCEILFPHSRVRGLTKLKGQEWRKLTERISALPETDIDALAFSHLMIKLCNCLNCDLSSYKAALGCSACSQRTISALQDSDQKLLRRFAESKEEILSYLDEKGLNQQKAA